MKKFGFLTVFLVGLVASYAPLTSAAMAAEKKVTLQCASAFSTALPVIGDGVHWFSQKVKDVSNGDITVKVFEPGKLVPPLQVHDAVSTGKINAGYTTSGYLVGTIPAADLFSSFPFNPDAPGFMAWFYQGNGLKLLQEMHETYKYNIKSFPIVFLSPDSGGWFKKRVDKPEDFKGLKVRFGVNGGQVLAKMGASVSMLPFTEVFAALEKGVIDGAKVSNPSADSKVGIYKVAKYNYFPGWHQNSTTGEFIINKDTWKNMSKAQQTMIELATMATNAYSLSQSTAIQARYIRENVEKHGTEVVQWSPEMIELFHKNWIEVANEQASKNPFYKKVWNDLQAFMTDLTYWESLGYLPRPKYKK